MEGRYVLSIVVSLSLFAFYVLLLVFVLFFVFVYCVCELLLFFFTNVIEHRWLTVNRISVTCCFVLLLLIFVYVRFCVFFKKQEQAQETVTDKLEQNTRANTRNKKQPQLLYVFVCLSVVGVRCSFLF